MVGPSARGSEYGTPSSMTSHPASSRATSALDAASSEGSPEEALRVRLLLAAFQGCVCIAFHSIHC
jgi:hypothetical protein